MDRLKRNNGNEQPPAHKGGRALVEAMDFVTRCRARDPLGNYPHIGDLQWSCRTGTLDDQRNWRFWRQDNGDAVALAIVVDNEILCLLHPDFRTHERYLTVRQWAIRRVKTQTAAQYEVWEEAASDDTEAMAFLEHEGYIRQEMYYQRYRRLLKEPVPAPVLPAGFTIRPIADEKEAEVRAVLQRDAFFPHSSKTYAEGMSRQLAVMAMPHYDPQLDLMVIAPDGTPAAGCVCWIDPVNLIGLFEPVGTRPQFRRLGLATALMFKGLQRLRERGMQAALVTGAHPGDEKKSSEFTSSRFVYEAVGFQLLRHTYTYRKMSVKP